MVGSIESDVLATYENKYSGEASAPLDVLMGLAYLGPLLCSDYVGLNVIVLPKLVALAQWLSWVLGIVGPGMLWRLHLL